MITPEQIEAMRMGMKASGMSDEYIEQTISAQVSMMEMVFGVQKNIMEDATANFLSGLTGQTPEEARKFVQDSDSCFYFAETPSVNKSYQWVIACGADMIHMRGDIINDISTGTHRDTCLIGLARQWEINSATDFEDMAKSLKSGHHSVLYHTVAGGMDCNDDYLMNLKENFDTAKIFFTRDGLIENGKTPNMFSWDLVRLINLTRWAFDAGLIDLDMTLAHLRDVSALVKNNYKSWQEISVGYQFARVMWGGITNDYKSLKDGMNELLTEPDSPWVTIPFDMKLNFDE